jgi:hypothetical protein
MLSSAILYTFYHNAYIYYRAASYIIISSVSIALAAQINEGKFALTV